MDMWDKTKIGPVASIHKRCQPYNKTNHSRQVVRVRQADGKTKHASHNADKMDPKLLRPQVALRVFVQQVTYEATHGPEHDVYEAEHCCPLAAVGLTETGEVLQVVRSENGVYGEFCAKGTEVTARHGERLEGAYYGEDLLSCGGLDDLVRVTLDHSIAAVHSFVDFGASAGCVFLLA